MRRRAMWVYETPELLSSGASRKELIEFCQPRGITDLFLQSHVVAGKAAQTYEVTDAAKLRNLLRELTAAGLRAHALLGDPAHTLRDHHDRVLARIDALLEFNRAGTPAERFSGIHLDVEPHGLPEWKSADEARKCDLLTQFVELNARVVDRLHERAPETVLGVDIAFWLDKTKPDGSPALPVTFRGLTTDATRHLLGFVDHLGIMSYRGRTEGPNGMIALVARSVASADELGKGRVFVGVKMAEIGPANESFYGRTEAEMNIELDKVDATYGSHRGYAGLAYFMYGAYRTMPR